MNSTELQAQLFSDLQAQAPITIDSALACAAITLKDYPKEKKEFGAWLEKNGAYLLQRVNGNG